MSPETKASRIEGLDWLRGLMAISVMVYHYIGWVFFKPGADTLIGRLGVYAVAIFFLLSGLSMAVVYNKFIKGFKSSIAFYIRRIFRIWPLMWVATILTVLPLMVFNHQFAWGRIFLNITTLFGFLAPGDYIPTGAWSIGNEMVYYAFTPIIIGLYNVKKMYGNMLTGAAIAVGLLFSHHFMNPNVLLGEQWHLLYINPFNNFFLYCMGVAIYYNLGAVRFSSWLCLLMISASTFAFIFLPGEKQSIHLVTGNGRIVFSLLCILLTIGFYKFDPKVPRMIKAPFDLFGMATYSVYLLHPILFTNVSVLLRKAGMMGSKGLHFAVPCILTIIISICTYYYFEKPFIKLGKRLTA